MTDLSNAQDAELLAAAGAPQVASTSGDPNAAYQTHVYTTGPDGKPMAVAAPGLASAPDADLLSAAHTQPLQSDEGLGFVRGLERPFRNATIWADQGLAQVPGIGQGQTIASNLDTLSQKLGLGSDQQFLNRPNQQLAAAIAQGKQPGAIGDAAGGFVGTLPLLAATKNPFVLGAAGGALQSQEGSSPTSVALNTGVGGVLGQGGQMATNALAHAISPVLAPAVQSLVNAGVKLTPGQLLGGGFRTVEDSLTHLPFLGNMIKGAQNQSLDTFNTAAINRSLAPIGEQLPAGMTPGHAAIEYANGKLSDAYSQVLPHINVTLDDGFNQNLAASTAQHTSLLPPTQKAQYAQILSDATGRAGPDGAMSGEAFQAADSQLGREARVYSKSLDPDQQKLGAAIKGAQGVFRDTAEAQNPWAAPQLQGARLGWANLARLEPAAAGAKGGVFTGPQLAAAVRAASSSPHGSELSQGHALMQDLSDAGTQVLPSTVADSGTALRGLMEAGVLGLGAHEAGVLNPTTAAGLGAAALPYTKPGLALSRAILGAPRPAPAPALAAAIRQLATVAGAGGALAPNAVQAYQPAQR
jgi:hypothetical protein